MDAGGRATQEQLPDARRPLQWGGLLFGYFLTPGSCPPPCGPASLFAPLLRRSGHARESKALARRRVKKGRDAAPQRGVEIPRLEEA